MTPIVRSGVLSVVQVGIASLIGNNEALVTGSLHGNSADLRYQSGPVQ